MSYAYVTLTVHFQVEGSEHPADAAEMALRCLIAGSPVGLNHTIETPRFWREEGVTIRATGIDIGPVQP